MASQQFPAGAQVNGLGLENQGLCWNPFLSAGASFYVVDGLGLQTMGMVWNAAANWAPSYQAQAVTWTGCSTCNLTCG